MKRSKKPQAKQKRSLIVALLVSTIFLCLSLMRKRLKAKDRQRLISKYKESISEHFLKLYSFFIPHHSNEYKPHVFRKRSVKNILLLVLVVKIALVSTLFILYPNAAKLNRDVVAKMYELINYYRSEKKIATLAPHEYLEQVALQKANDMLEHNYFSHFGVDGKKPWQWIDTSVYNYRSMGENLAMDFITAEAVFKAFQNSPSHDRNLLNSSYQHIGVAMKNGYLDGHDATVMVVMFASPRPVPTVAPVVQKPASTELPVTETLKTPAAEPVQPKPAEQPAPPQEPEEQVAGVEVGDESGAAEALQPVAATDESLGISLDSEREFFIENLSSGVTFSQGSFIQRLIAWSDRFFTLFLIALVLLLIINIVVKIRVQHASVIANAILLIAVVYVALYSNVHRAEAVAEQVRILSHLLL